MVEVSTSWLGLDTWLRSFLEPWGHQVRNHMRGHWVSEVAQSCLTLCDPMGCSLPSSSVHGILQARILEWVAISFSRVSSRPRDQTPVSRIVGRLFNLWATREAPEGTLGTCEKGKPFLSIIYNSKREACFSPLGSNYMLCPCPLVFSLSD